MSHLKGIGVSEGFAMATLFFIKRQKNAAKQSDFSGAEQEQARLSEAMQAADNELLKLYSSSIDAVGEENAEVFEIHRMMLQDLDYRDSIALKISEDSLCAQEAVRKTGEEFALAFSQMEDEYMRARAADVRDISSLLVRILTGESANPFPTEGSFIIAADELAPSETSKLDRKRCLGIVTQKGSKTSHMAIFARAMGIPAVVGVGEALGESLNNLQAMIDGFSGEVVISPSAQEQSAFSKKQQQLLKAAEELNSFRGMRCFADNKNPIEICANIGSDKDIDAVLSSDAEGIGLFRSEFLYLGKSDYPTEEEQFKAYRAVAQAMNGKRVIIRTLDIGADKQADYFKLPQEENPALGIRAIRICLERPEIFITQLRALLRASAFGKVAIMLPMIISEKELLQAKAHLETAKLQLRQEGIAFNETTEFGIMIETPAAAIMSDVLAKECDFFSIGTNDLTQYTLAADRQNPKLDAYCDKHDPALLRLIEYAAQSAHKAGIWIGICGELGADAQLIPFFKRIGIDELSVSPSAVLKLRAKMCKA